nr:MAG TPA: hypothetical protein [Caudoviricetes sp.]
MALTSASAVRLVACVGARSLRCSRLFERRVWCCRFFSVCVWRASGES